MNAKTTIILAALLLSPLMTAWSHAKDPAFPTVKEALAVLEAINVSYEQIDTVEYQVESILQDGKTSITSRWHFVYQPPNHLRVEYQEPEERLLIFNPGEIWEYFPSRQTAHRSDLTKLPPEEQRQRLQRTLARAKIDGLFPGVITTPIKSFRPVMLSPVDRSYWRLVGGAPEIRFDVDPIRNTLPRMEVYTESRRLKLRTEGFEYIEVSPGFYMPQLLFCTYALEGRYATRAIRLTHIKAGHTISPMQFQFKPGFRTTVLGDVPDSNTKK